MSIEQIIQNRMSAMKTQFASNRIEGEVDEKIFINVRTSQRAD